VSSENKGEPVKPKKGLGTDARKKRGNGRNSNEGFGGKNCRQEGEKRRYFPGMAVGFPNVTVGGGQKKKKKRLRPYRGNREAAVEAKRGKWVVHKRNPKGNETFGGNAEVSDEKTSIGWARAEGE